MIGLIDVLAVAGTIFGAYFGPALAPGHVWKVGMAGLVHTYLTQRLHLRYVGFGKKIGLRIPEGTGGLKALGEPIAAGGGNVALRVLSHNVWCHYLQQWYVPSMGVRLHALADAVEREAYHLVLVQELFLLRVGPFAITHEWEEFAGRMAALGFVGISDPRASLPLFGQNSGLAIFSRAPFVAPPASESFSVTGERVCVKGLVHADVPLGNGRRLHVATTHLDSKRRPRDVQERQAAELRAAAVEPYLEHGAARGPASGTALLVAGDFNVCSLGSKDDGTQYRLLAQAMAPLLDAYGPARGAVVPTRRPNTKPWARGKGKGSKGPGEKGKGSNGKALGAIDHAFLAGAAACDAELRDFRVEHGKGSKGIVCSDHLGLHMTVTL